MKIFKWAITQVLVPSIVALFAGGGLFAYISYLESHKPLVEKAKKSSIKQDSVIEPSSSKISSELYTATEREPLELKMNIDTFLHKLWSRELRPSQYLGFRVNNWTMDVCGNNPEMGSNTLDVYDAKFQITVDKTHPFLMAQLKNLNSTDTIRVSGILDERSTPRLGRRVMLVVSNITVIEKYLSKPD